MTPIQSVKDSIGTANRISVCRSTSFYHSLAEACRYALGDTPSTLLKYFPKTD